MENSQPKRSRRSRRKKPVEVVADAPTLDSTELEAEGFEKEEPVIQAAQEPVTTPIVEPAPQPTKPDPEEAPKPWQKPIRPMKKKKEVSIQRGIRRRQR